MNGQRKHPCLLRSALPVCFVFLTAETPTEKADDPHRWAQPSENHHTIKAINTTEMGRNDPMVVCMKRWEIVVQSKLGSVRQPAVVCTLSRAGTCAHKPDHRRGTNATRRRLKLKGSEHVHSYRRSLADMCSGTGRFSRTCNGVSAKQ